MKRFLAKAALFGTLMLALFFLFELLLMTKTNDYSFKRRLIENHLDDTSVLILGHSHLEVGLNPRILGDSCINMAMSGRWWYYDLELVRRYVPRMPHLRVVVVPYRMDYQYYHFALHPASESRMRGRRTQRCMQLKYMNIGWGNFPYTDWSELLNSNLDLLGRLMRNDSLNVIYDSLGFWPLFLAQRKAGWEEVHLPDTLDYAHPERGRSVAEFKESIRAMSEICAARGAKLVILTTPCYRTYRERLTERSKREAQEMAVYFASLPNAEYHNFLDDPRFVEDDFRDSSHLSEVGAEKFSRIVRELLVEEGLIGD